MHITGIKTGKKPWEDHPWATPSLARSPASIVVLPPSTPPPEATESAARTLGTVAKMQNFASGASARPFTASAAAAERSASTGSSSSVEVGTRVAKVDVAEDARQRRRRKHTTFNLDHGADVGHNFLKRFD